MKNVYLAFLSQSFSIPSYIQIIQTEDATIIGLIDTTNTASNISQIQKNENRSFQRMSVPIFIQLENTAKPSSLIYFLPIINETGK